MGKTFGEGIDYSEKNLRIYFFTSLNYYVLRHGNICVSKHNKTVNAVI
jgi:hypothetical protein